jgi:hypothetical protein
MDCRDSVPGLARLFHHCSQGTDRGKRKVLPNVD